MRFAPVLFALLVLIVGALFFAWLGRSDQDSPAEPFRPGDFRVVTDGGAAQSTGAGTGGERAPDGVEAARKRAPGAAGTVRYRVIDADRGTAVPDVTVWVASSGEPLLRAPDGVVETERDPAELVFTAPGHLLGFFGAGAHGSDELRAAAARGTADVPLYADEFTIPWRFAFVASGGEPARDVRFRILCLDEPPPIAGPVPTERIGPGARIDADLRDAWQTHVVMSQLPALQEAVAGHFGLQSATHVYECATGHATVRFVASGTYLLEAASASGEIARQSFAVTLDQRAPMRVPLSAGRYLEGVVRSAGDGSPIAGVELYARDAPLGVGSVRTDAGGAFRIGPLGSAPITLDARHADFEPGTVGPRRPGGAPVELRLVPRPQLEVRGIVRARPKGDVIAGADVQLVELGQVLASARTDARGRFALKTRLQDAEILIRAPGYQDYAEIISPAEPPDRYDLIPDTPARRVAAGMTGLLSGTVIGPDGEPRGGTPVRVFPDNETAVHGIAGRRILRGGILALPHLATAAADGSFELECMTDGPARLLAIQGLRRPEDGLPVAVRLGATRDGIVLRTAD